MAREVNSLKKIVANDIVAMVEEGLNEVLHEKLYIAQSGAWSVV